VILIGGGSRVPRVQEILTEYVGRELGKNMNTDESAAMGPVYKAADLSTGNQASVSALDPHVWSPWIRIRILIRIQSFFFALTYGVHQALDLDQRIFHTLDPDWQIFQTLDLDPDI